jgi:hypothetical protein
MRSRVRGWWPALKVLFGLVIVVAIGRQFARDLQRPEVWQRSLHPGWLVVAGLLYLLGLTFSAFYWIRLLGHLGPRPPLTVALRAYFLGHMGKYVPGKAWAVFLRASLVRSAGVRLGIATLTTFYEVLTTMAAGALVAAILFALLGSEGAWLDTEDLLGLLRLERPKGGVIGRWPAVVLCLGLLLGIGLPCLPPLFNRLAHHLSLPFRDAESSALPHLRLAFLFEGFLFSAFGWLLLGASVVATFQAILGPTPALDRPETVGLFAAIMALSYVVGFVILVAPSGLGVREFFLTLFLTPELITLCGLAPEDARGTAVLGVLVVRLVWTTAELVVVGLLFWWPRGSSRVASSK